MKKIILLLLLTCACARATTNYISIPYWGFLYGGGSGLVDTNRYKLTPWWVPGNSWTNNPWTTNFALQTNVALFGTNSGFVFQSADLANIPGMGFGLGTNAPTNIFNITPWQAWQAQNWMNSNIDARLAGFTNTVWVAPGPTNAGTGTVNGYGTYTYPYIGDFDQIISNTPTFTDIRLFPGVYWKNTQNGATLRTGQRLLGAGMDITIIRRDLSTGNGRVIQSISNQVEVADVTLDANAVNLTNNTPGASNATFYDSCGLFGSYEAIRRVHSINCYGDRTNGQEMFALSVGGNGTTNGSHNVIEDCWVNQVLGNYGGGINVFSGGAVVANNLVELPPIANSDPPFFYCYGIEGSWGTVLKHNTGIGGEWGFYTDSYSDTNLTMVGNVFSGNRGGINFSKFGGAVYGLKILDNFIDLDPAASLFAAGMRLWATNGIYNMTVSGNIVHFRDDLQYPTNTGLLPAFQCGTNISAVAPGAPASGTLNMKIFYNTFGTNMPIHTGTTNLIFTGNTDPNGLLLTNTP